MTDSFSYDGNAPMLWTTGREAPFTKTPANVPANYVETHDEEIPGATPAKQTTGMKRKSAASNTISETARPTKKAKPTPSSTAGTNEPGKRKRKTGKKGAAARIIPRSYDECCEADQALLTMRDAGEEWPAIRARWQALTGEKAAASTLPNRYARLKSNFTVIREEDNGRLLMAKREVEESFETQKWDLVARVVSEKGGDSYAAVVLKRQYRKLMVDGGLQTPVGVRDADFEVEGEEVDDGDDEDGDEDEDENEE